MRSKFFIFLFLFISYVILSSISVHIKDERFIVNDFKEISGEYSSKDVSYILNKVLSSNVLIKKLKIKRRNFSFLNIGNEFDVEIKKNFPDFEVLNEVVNVKNTIKTSFLNTLKVDFGMIWKAKSTLKRYNPKFISFLGYIKVNGKKEVYIYFNNEVIKVDKKIGDRRVIRVFKDGILLLTPTDSFEVIM